MNAMEQQIMEDRIAALEAVIEKVLPLLVEASANLSRVGVVLSRLDADPPEQYADNAALSLLLDKVLPAAGA